MIQLLPDSIHNPSHLHLASIGNDTTHLPVMLVLLEARHFLAPDVLQELWHQRLKAVSPPAGHEAKQPIKGWAFKVHTVLN
jgi:hypothetical protein